jgi:predicted O-methyltransferase YrrM
MDEWMAAVIERHTASLTRPEFLKSIRALSARYVEQRSSLVERSVLDTAGKRAAFAAFYAPLHFLTMREIVQQLGVAATASRPGQQIDTIVDLGCGTGVAGAALALAFPKPPRLEGVDLHPWAVDETRWTWRTLGLSGSARRGPLEQRLATLAGSRTALDTTAIVCGWSLNELPSPKRTLAIDALMNLAARGASVLIVEPVARRLVPWWDAFATRAVAAGGRSDEWRFPPALPPALADLDEAAGFDREALSARSVSWGWR